MNWRYHIPSIWHSPRQVWEDIFLLPDAPDYEGDSIWLTIDALGDPDNPAHGSDRAEFIVEALVKLGNNPFWIDGTDMIVRAVDFDKAELLAWVKIWLTETGLLVDHLIETPLEPFVGTNPMATTLKTLQEVYDDDWPP